MVKRLFQSNVNSAKTRCFPGDIIGSDYDLLMMTCRLRLQTMKTPDNERIRFRFEKVKDPNIAENFRAAIGLKFAPLVVLYDQDTEIDALTTALTLP